MYWDVVKVTPETHLTLSVCFADGIAGKVRFKKSHLIGVFAPLKQAHFFKKVFVNEGVVTWPGEIDLAPDAMHDAIEKHGEWVLK